MIKAYKKILEGYLDFEDVQHLQITGLHISKNTIVTIILFS